MYKKLFIVMIISLLTLTSCKSTEKFSNVSKFKYYLDKGTPKIGNEMKKMDLVIIEPLEMEQKYIEAAQKEGTLVYGYINALEGDKWNKKLYKKFKETDFYHDKTNERLYFSQWDSYMMDITSEHYQELLLEEIKREIVTRKLDGVFLDTVGNIDSFIDQSEQTEMNEALVTFMKKIKKDHNISIGQNWGFNTFKEHTNPYIDFIMWEDFSYKTIAEDEWSQEQIETLEQTKIPVLAIGFSDEKKSKKIAKQHNFKFQYNEAGSYYNTW